MMLNVYTNEQINAGVSFTGDETEAGSKGLFFPPCFQILCKIAYVIPISRKYDAARLLYELIVA